MDFFTPISSNIVALIDDLIVTLRHQGLFVLNRPLYITYTHNIHFRTGSLILTIDTCLDPTHKEYSHTRTQQHLLPSLATHSSPGSHYKVLTLSR